MAMTPEEKKKRIAELEKQAEALAKDLGVERETGSGAKTDPIVRDIVPWTTALALGFGDDKAADKELEKRGYASAGRNKHGQLIAKDKEGNWVTDNNNLLLNTPRAIPQTLGVVASMFPQGRLAQIAAAAAAGLMGSGAKQMVGSLVGTNTQGPEEGMTEALTEAAQAGGGNALGQALGRIPAPGPVVRKFGVKNLDELAAHAARKLFVEPAKSLGIFSAGKLSGAGTEAARRVVDRPVETSAALEPRSIANLTEQGRKELEEAMAALGIRSRAARKAFLERHGYDLVETAPIVEGRPAVGDDQGFRGVNQILAENAPNASGRGPMTEAELNAIRSLRDEDLLSPAQASFDLPIVQDGVQPGLPLQGVKSRPMKTGTPGSVPASEGQPTLGLLERELLRMQSGEPINATHVQDPLSTLAREEVPAQMSLFGGSVEGRISPALHEQPRMANSHPGTRLTQRMQFSKYGGTPGEPATPSLNLKTGQSVMPGEPGFRPQEGQILDDLIGEQLGLALDAQKSAGPIASELQFEKALPADQLGLPLSRQRRFPINTSQNAPQAYAQHQYGLPLPPQPRTRKRADSLMKTVDWLDRQVVEARKKAFDMNMPSDQVPKDVKVWKDIRGATKEQLHALDPVYRAEDAVFENASNQEELLHPLTRPGTAESFTKGLANPEAKVAVKDAAKALTPGYYGGIEDMGAALAFQKPGLLRGWISPRKALGLAAAGTAGTAAYNGGQADPGTMLALTALAAGMTSPRLNQAILARGSRMLGTPWSLLGQRMKSMGQAASEGALYRWMAPTAVNLAPRYFLDEEKEKK